MRLATLIAGIPGILATSGDTDVEVSSIFSDSRQVTPGALFVAYRGVGTDSHRFIPDAISRGATVIVEETQPSTVPHPNVVYLQVRDGRAALGWLSAAWAGYPSRHLKLVGVTGTDGKTTTTNVLHGILRSAGLNAGLISTVNAVIGEETYETGLHTTTPDAPDVQQYLAQMVEAGTEVAILETTSHGLAQHRVTGCAFDIAVVTNITHEHLDFHGSYQNYREAKAMLFRMLGESEIKPGIRKTRVLNADDASYSYLLGIPAEHTLVYHHGTEPLQPLPDGAFTEIVADNIRQDAGGLHFDIEWRPVPALAAPLRWTLHSSLIGEYNVSNILAACGAAIALGVDPEAITKGVRGVAGIPGRLERIDRGQDFTAIVDFAHTPNALTNVLQTVRALAEGEGSRVIVVFGSAGLRDRTKRSLMGEAAAQYADFSVITAEDPRTEDLAAILDETARAMQRMGRVEGRDFMRIPDRQRAILYAVQQAQPGDVVIVCGKGHEQSMCFDAVEHPWRDQDALAWALDTLNAAAAATPPYILPTWKA